MVGALFMLANFSDADLAGLEATGTNFVEADFMLDAAEMQGANLSGVKAGNASFRQADLTAADLADGHFARADFKDANLRRTSLDGADLAQARKVSQHQLNSAIAPTPGPVCPPGSAAACVGTTTNGAPAPYRVSRSPDVAAHITWLTRTCSGRATGGMAEPVRGFSMRRTERPWILNDAAGIGRFR